MDIFPVVPGMTLELGKTGTHYVRAFRFDISAWQEAYPDGIINLLHRLPAANEPYVAGYLRLGEGYIDWVVQSSDVAVPGYGECELVMIVDGVAVDKTDTYPTHIEEQLGSNSVTPPTGATWVEQVLTVGNATLQAVEGFEDLVAEKEQDITDLASGKEQNITDLAAQKITAIETKGAQTLASIPADYTELSEDVDDLKSALNHNVYTADNAIYDLSSIVTDALPVRKKYRLGRYLLNGFYDNLTNYIRNAEPFPAGKYRVGEYNKGKVVIGYLSDTQGVAIKSSLQYGAFEFETEYDFYISFSGVTENDIEDIENNFVITRITNESGTSLVEKVSQLQTKSDGFDAFIDTVSEEVESQNRFNGEIQEGYFVSQQDGKLYQNNVYSATDFIKVANPTNKVIISGYWNITTSAMRVAYYTEADESTFVRGELLNADNVFHNNGRFHIVIDITDANYIRFSASTGWFTSTQGGHEPLVSVEYGDTAPTAYHSYTGDKTMIRESVLPDMSGDVEGYDIIQSMTVSKSPLIGSAETLTDGQYIKLESNSIRKNKKMSFFCKITSFGSVFIGKGEGITYNGFGIVVDGTNISTSIDGVTFGTSVPHGLTIEDYLMIVIDIGELQAFTVTLSTHGGQFVRHLTGWSGFRGEIFVKSIGSTLTDCHLTWQCDDYKKRVWAFGDSYFSHFSNNRWPYWLLTWGYDNCLLNGFPGENSADAYPDLTKALQHGTPKYLVWCLGMNDPDTSSAINATWLEKVQSIEEICESKDIELILATIPNVTNATYSNVKKNEWIRTSGHRYIDFAKAVGAETSPSSWNEDYLSDDGVHPSETGARILCARALVDCPEFMQE